MFSRNAFSNTRATSLFKKFSSQIPLPSLILVGTAAKRTSGVALFSPRPLLTNGSGAVGGGACGNGREGVGAGQTVRVPPGFHRSEALRRRASCASPLFRVVRRFADGATGRRDGHSLVPRTVRVVQAYPAMHAACWTRVRATGRVLGRRPPHPRRAVARASRPAVVSPTTAATVEVLSAPRSRGRAKSWWSARCGGAHSSTTHTGSWIQAWAAGSRRSVGLYRPSPATPSLRGPVGACPPRAPARIRSDSLQTKFARIRGGFRGHFWVSPITEWAQRWGKGALLYWEAA